MESGLIVVATTLPGDWHEAQVGQFAQAVLDGGGAACVQFNRITSHYVWEGAAEVAAEWRLLIKAAAEHEASLEATIRDLHPHRVPQIIAWTARANRSYLDWVMQAED